MRLIGSPKGAGNSALNVNQREREPRHKTWANFWKFLSFERLMRMGRSSYSGAVLPLGNLYVTLRANLEGVPWQLLTHVRFWK